MWYNKEKRIEKTKDAREKGLQQEMGEQITPAQKEEREQEEIRTEEFGSEREQEHGTLKMAEIGKAIRKGNITSDKLNKSQQELRQDIKETEKRKEFQQLMFLGSRRTAEQQRRFEELNNKYYQTSERQSQQQSNGIEMWIENTGMWVSTLIPVFIICPL